MSNALALVESALQPLAPSFAQVLPPEIPPARLIRTVLVACEQNPYLLECDRGSLLRSAMTAAVLGLEVDNVIGSIYLVPFKRKVQALVGYKGFAQLAARSGRTLEGYVVREGDGFKFDEANGIVAHERVLGRESERKVLAAYAVSRSDRQPQMVRVLSIDQLIETRNKSAGYQSLGDRSTWATNFDAMCRKTPIRRLATDIPALSLQAAAALDTQHDLGKHAYIRDDRSVIVDGEIVQPPAGPQPPPSGLTSRPEFKVFYPNETAVVSDAARYRAKILTTLDKLEPEQARKFKALNMAHAERLMLEGGIKEVGAVVDAFNAIEG